MYGDSQALSSSDDSNPMFPLSSKAIKDVLNIKSKELFMESDEYIQYTHHHSQNDNPGLLRFLSAPGSLFANIAAEGVDKNGEKCDVFEDDKVVINGYGVSSSQLPPQYPRKASVAMAAHGGYGVVNHHPRIASNNLVRQNSSPAGLFSHLTSQNEYAALRGVESYSVANGVSGEFTPSVSRLKGQMCYSSSLSSPLGVLSRISEVENGNVGASGADKKSGNENREAQFYSPAGFPFGSWNDSSKFGENFYGLKREAEVDVKPIANNSQTAELRNQPPILSRHSSLPNSSASMEKLLHFQDTVPCKLRAKRGFATHPRSIAERVRRTRISERMRKLQELVPNMDKQTNTADMLDLAVGYIKDLRKQYKTLTDLRANCKCTALQKPPALNHKS